MSDGFDPSLACIVNGLRRVADNVEREGRPRLSERCGGSDLLCDDDDRERQVCPGCGFVVQTRRELFLGRRWRRRFPEHQVSALHSLADFVDQLRTG